MLSHAAQPPSPVSRRRGRRPAPAGSSAQTPPRPRTAVDRRPPDTPAPPPPSLLPSRIPPDSHPPRRRCSPALQSPDRPPPRRTARPPPVPPSRLFLPSLPAPRRAESRTRPPSGQRQFCPCSRCTPPSPARTLPPCPANSPPDTCPPAGASSSAPPVRPSAR